MVHSVWCIFPKLLIDEYIVPYFRSHSANLFIRGKPIRFGFKLWCVASTGGYVYQFDPYGRASQKTSENLGLYERVVSNLLKVFTILKIIPYIIIISSLDISFLP